MNDIPPEQSLIANRVLAYAQAKDESFSFDPFTIMAICNCIISVVKLLYMCYSKDSVASAIKRRSYLHTILLKREVRKNFKDKQHRKIMFKSIKEVGASMSEMELHNLMDSIQE
tara:strand:- start:56 stop:397 length:342 start_codon:yes stop_codon:yes gene_type:complete